MVVKFCHPFDYWSFDYVVEDNAQKTYLGAHSSSRERKGFSKQEYQILRDSITRNGKEGYSPKDRFQ